MFPWEIWKLHACPSYHTKNMATCRAHTVSQSVRHSVLILPVRSPGKIPQTQFHSNQKWMNKYGQFHHFIGMRIQITNIIDIVRHVISKYSTLRPKSCLFLWLYEMQFQSAQFKQIRLTSNRWELNGCMILQLLEASSPKNFLFPFPMELVKARTKSSNENRRLKTNVWTECVFIWPDQLYHKRLVK